MCHTNRGTVGLDGKGIMRVLGLLLTCYVCAAIEGFPVFAGDGTALPSTSASNTVDTRPSVNLDPSLIQLGDVEVHDVPMGAFLATIVEKAEKTNEGIEYDIRFYVRETRAVTNDVPEIWGRTAFRESWQSGGRRMDGREFPCALRVSVEMKNGALGDILRLVAGAYGLSYGEWFEGGKKILALGPEELVDTHSCLVRRVFRFPAEAGNRLDRLPRTLPPVGTGIAYDPVTRLMVVITDSAFLKDLQLLITSFGGEKHSPGDFGDRAIL